MKCHKTTHQDALIKSNGVRAKDGADYLRMVSTLAGNEEVDGQPSGHETSKGKRLKYKRLRFVEEREEAGKGLALWSLMGNGKRFGFTLMDLRKYLG